MTRDCKEIWHNCLQLIKENIGEQSFKTWFAPIVPVKLTDNVLIIQVPTQFFYEWLEEHYVHLLRQAIVQELGESGRLEYSIIVDKGNDTVKPVTINLPTSKTGSSSSQPAKSDNNNRQSENYRGPFHQERIETEEFQPQLNSTYTFDSYIEGDCNMLARSAGFAVANKPGTTSFNPLMIYGGVGLGKTHLIQAIGNQVKRDNPRARVLYVPTDKFTNQFIDALRKNNTQEFINYYMQVDVLLIDDIQFLAGRGKTQEIFFNIFNELHQSNRQIVLTSDRPAKELKDIEERLLSRFKWGLTADLRQPDFETRMAIIGQKMHFEGIEIPDAVVEYLAYSLDTNVREMEGVLISLIAHSSLRQKEIDLELAKRVLNHIVQDNETEVGIDFIQKSVADYFKVPYDELKAKTRKKEIVLARQVAMYFCKNYTDHSLKSIGYYFGGRDHSTVIHAVQCIKNYLKVDARLRGKIEEVERKLKANVTA